MYPYFTIAGLKIYMTGLGIVLGFLCFLATVWYASKQYRLSFPSFFYRLPVYIAIIYVCGAYGYFVIDDPGLLYPASWQQLIMLLSPHGYRFHFLGLLVGVIIATWLFLLQIPSKTERILRIDALFYGWGVALIPVGLFFVLGENFIGQLVEPGHGRGVTSLHPDLTTRLRKFNQPVLPIGLRLSIGSACIVIGCGLRATLKRRIGYGYYGFLLLLALFFVILLYQQYPRHLPLGRQLDIKHYGIVIGMIFLYYRYSIVQRYLATKPS